MSAGAEAPTSIVYSLPVQPGRAETWRRFCQELAGACSREYTASRRRLGIVRERAWLMQTSQAEIVILYIEAAEPLLLLPMLSASAHPFDRWLVQQLRELHGLDARQLARECLPELVFGWDLAPTDM